MLGCQAVHRWTQNPSKCGQAFTAHFFRAMLQLVLSRHHPSVIHEREQSMAGSGAVRKELSLGRMPARAMRDWPTYLQIAMERLKLDPPAGGIEAMAAAVLEECEPCRVKVSAYWALRAVLAPVVESLVLIDRVLYLTEQGIPSVELLPVFDPAISPRNFAIIASKQVGA